MQVFNRNVSVRGLTVFGFEVVLISGSMAFAAQLHGAFTPGSTIWQIVVVTALCQLCFYYNDLYDLTVVHSNGELLVRLLQGAGAAAIVLALMGIAVPSLILDPGTFLTALGVFVVAILTWRIAFNHFAHDPHLEERILIVGTGQTARMLAQQIGTQQDFAYRLVGFIEESDDAPIVRQHDILGTASEISRIVRERRVDRIVVGLSDRRGHLPIEQLLRAKVSGVRVEDAMTTYERLTGKILIDHLKPSWLIFSDGFRASRATRMMKRMLDLSLSIVGVVLSAPLMVLTAVAIRLDSAGPIVYSQARVGEHGRLFNVYKFRSMRTDAERGGMPIWAQEKDERVTRVGRIIRKTRLDELPQFWNVMRGDMSFVGPRPERPFFVDQLARQIPFYVQRHSVKPGLTGWAQVKYQYGSSVEDAMEKLRYDLYYIKHLSIVFDLTIVLDTVKVILFGKGREVTQGEDQSDAIWGEPDDRQLATVARNVTTRYLSIATDAVIGLMLLPFNVHHLGPAAYGLWMLTASMTTYFSVLDLGFGGSIVKFVAHYRAKRDTRGLNEIASTLFVIFSAVGIVAYAVFVLLAFNLRHVLNITPEQAVEGRSLMLIIGVYVSLGFPFSVFGGVINGFQRYDLNNLVGVGSSVVVAIVNVAMLMTGCSLVELVMTTTSIRIVAYFIYRLNAYAVFRPLSLRPALFKWSRVRELTSFSVYVSLIDWANKLNYSIDAVIIGAYLSASAVTLWTVPQRLAEMLQRLTNQVNGVLFPVVVDSDAGQKAERLRAIFIQGTRLSLVSVLPLGASLVLLAGPLIHAWVGPKFDDSIIVTQILIAVVTVRVGNSTATTVLKGAGCHRLLAFSNLGAALANVALSLLWIRHYGLIGQAMGTFVPVAFTSVFILWPAACRRVGIGAGRAFVEAIWPTLWPVGVMALVVIPVRQALPERLFAVALAGAIGALCYLATFLAFAVKRDERRTYIAKASELARSRRRRVAAAA